MYKITAFWSPDFIESDGFWQAFKCCFFDQAAKVCSASVAGWQPLARNFSRAFTGARTIMHWLVSQRETTRKCSIPKPEALSSDCLLHT